MVLVVANNSRNRSMNEIVFMDLARCGRRPNDKYMEVRNE